MMRGSGYRAAADGLGADRSAMEALPISSRDSGRYRGSNGWGGKQSDPNSWPEWGAADRKSVGSNRWRQRPSRGLRSGVANGGRHSDGRGPHGGSRAAPIQPAYTPAAQTQEPPLNLDSPQGPPMPVLVSGLPPALCSKMCMEAVLEQAGLEDAVLGVEMSSGDAILHLSSWSAASQCLAHFNGCRWDATGPPVTASWATVEVQAVQPVQSVQPLPAVPLPPPQVVPVPVLSVIQPALPADMLEVNKRSSSPASDDHEDSTTAGSPLSADDSSYDTDDGF